MWCCRPTSTSLKDNPSYDKERSIVSKVYQLLEPSPNFKPTVWQRCINSWNPRPVLSQRYGNLCIYSSQISEVMYIGALCLRALSASLNTPPRMPVILGTAHLCPGKHNVSRPAMLANITAALVHVLCPLRCCRKTP